MKQTLAEKLRRRAAQQKRLISFILPVRLIDRIKHEAVRLNVDPRCVVAARMEQSYQDHPDARQITEAASHEIPVPNGESES